MEGVHEKQGIFREDRNKTDLYFESERNGGNFWDTWGKRHFQLIIHIESKRERGKQRITYVTSLCKRMEEQGVGEILKI